MYSANYVKDKQNFCNVEADQLASLSIFLGFSHLGQTVQQFEGQPISLSRMPSSLFTSSTAVSTSPSEIFASISACRSTSLISSGDTRRTLARSLFLSVGAHLTVESRLRRPKYSKTSEEFITPSLFSKRLLRTDVSLRVNLTSRSTCKEVSVRA